jgi:hypothetical protein
MGMFDKDKEIGLLLTSAFNQGEQFVLWNAYIDREDFPTQYGPVPRASLDVSKIDNQRAGQKFTVNSVASAVVAKVRDAERDDFPAVVFWRKAPSARSSSGEALVLQFVSAWGNAAPEDRPPEVREDPDLMARSGGRDFTTAPDSADGPDDDTPAF